MGMVLTAVGSNTPSFPDVSQLTAVYTSVNISTGQHPLLNELRETSENAIPRLACEWKPFKGRKYWAGV